MIFFNFLILLIITWGLAILLGGILGLAIFGNLLAIPLGFYIFLHYLRLIKYISGEDP
jgi:hypothetical protein